MGGNNPLAMKDLVRNLQQLGFSGVSTYIQSGNVLFRNSGGDAESLARLIAGSVAENHGFEPGIVVLGADELKQAASNNPYPDAEADPKSLHLYFLAESPGQVEFDTLERLRSSTESYELKDRCFYLHAPDGVGRSKLARGAERAIGVDATARNWRTVSKLLQMICDT